VGPCSTKADESPFKYTYVGKLKNKKTKQWEAVYTGDTETMFKLTPVQSGEGHTKRYLTFEQKPRVLFESW